MLGIRWSDDTQNELDRQREVNEWYTVALKTIKERQIQFLGKPLNLSNPKEIIAFLYVWNKDYSLFHEEL